MSKCQFSAILGLPPMLVALAIALCVSAPPSAVAQQQPAATEGGLEGVEITHDDSKKITWYKPKVNQWKMFDFRISPSIGRTEDGARKMVVAIVVKDPPKGRPSSLQVDTSEEALVVPISSSERIETHDSGCRVTQTVYLQNQVPLVQALAKATDAKIALVGYQHTVKYKMTAEDLANISRMAELWNAPEMPPPPKQPMHKSSSPGSFPAGEKGITNPEIIRSSKVQPRFPEFAQGKQALGRVKLQAVIKKDGTVGDIEILEPAGGDCGFEQSAIEAVSLWRYKPGMKDGEPVDIYFTVVIDFTYGNYRMATGPP